MRRLAAKVVGTLVVVLLALFATTYVYLRRSLPRVDGTVTVEGPGAPIDIVRDRDAVPHVLAGNRADALFGLGYVHAQDRLWQMEFQRRIAHGRLSEVFGAATLGQDRFLRTLGTGRAARAAWDRLPATARDDVTAYVAGVNAFLATHSGSRLPPEFTILRFRPEPWTGPDVIGWIKMMAWDLSANYSAELLRHDLSALVGPARTDQLMPPDSPDALAIVPPPATNPSSASLQPVQPVQPLQPVQPMTPWTSALAEALSGHPSVRDLLLGGARVEGLGSNSWVVGGARTATGTPLLANDPHLATRIPSVWYLAHVSGGDLDVIGATLPGVPGIAIGRNRSIAWGLTNVAADVQDLYLERLDAEGRAAEFQGAFEPLRTITEVIVVQGQDPVDVTVRLSRHGPLISDAINANATAAGGAATRAPLPPLALRWTALDDEDTTVLAFLGVNAADNWTEFTAALRHFVVPSQNVVYADVEGHIGYYAPGRIPVRAAGDGTRPLEGWTGGAEWTGWVPFEALPHVFDPPEGVIVAANNRPAAPPYPHLIGSDFPEPYRAQRIVDLIGARPGLTTVDVRVMQADTLSLHARTLLPLLLARVEGATDDERQAIDRLAAWNFDAHAGSPEAALFQAWFVALAPALIADEVGDAVLAGYEGRFSYVTRFLVRTLQADDRSWCDDTRTEAPEACADIVSATFRAARDRVSGEMGRDMSVWRWDRLHRAVFPHQGLDAVGLLRPLLSRSAPGTGDWSTVNVGPTAADRPFEQRSVPSYRQVVDLSPANASGFLDAVGQSGHFLSPHYDDFLPDWTSVRYRAMRTSREAIDDGAIGTLRLVPPE